MPAFLLVKNVIKLKSLIGSNYFTHFAYTLYKFSSLFFNILRFLVLKTFTNVLI